MHFEIHLDKTSYPTKMFWVEKIFSSEEDCYDYIAENADLLTGYWFTFWRISNYPLRSEIIKSGKINGEKN